jgi:peptidoglycan/xylan/chitin deacetylase (PgdA/CDA1 family)
MPCRSKGVRPASPDGGSATWPAPPGSACAAGATTSVASAKQTAKSAERPRPGAWLAQNLTSLVWTDATSALAPRTAISPPRKILCICLLAALAPLGAALAADPAPRAGGGGLERATLSQAGRNLVFAVRTGAPVALRRLDRSPDLGSGRAHYLCLTMRKVGRRGLRRICLGGPRSQRRAGLQLLNARGGVKRSSTIAVRLKRPRARKLVASLLPRAAGLEPHRYRWRAIENRRGCRGCSSSLPPGGSRLFRLRPVRAVGCTGGNARLVTNGPRNRKAVALTFDDGPSGYTDDYLDVLRRGKARATFFVLGQEIAGRRQPMRRILREGSEIGNHTAHHDYSPSYWDLASSSALIRSATGFRPCLFRPPGGALSSGVIAAAGSLGMTTIYWDVDPTDWSNPGSGAVYSRVVGAVRPGSIVVMHDGRGGTLAALPAIISTLRARGYRLVTVSELLGNRLIYRPYG